MHRILHVCTFLYNYIYIMYVYELSRFSRCSTLLHIKHNHTIILPTHWSFRMNHFTSHHFSSCLSVDWDKTHLINHTVICQWWYRIQISILLSRRSNSAADISWSLCSVQLRIFSCLFVDRYRALSAENRSCSAPLETFHSLPIRSIPSPLQRTSRSFLTVSLDFIDDKCI